MKTLSKILSVLLNMIRDILVFPFYLIYTFYGMFWLLINNIKWYWTGTGLD